MFNRDHKKLNSKIRFQNQSFKHRLEAARGYKRPKRSLPQTDWAVFLSRVGLGSWFSRLFTLLIFLGLVYIVFIPNFLFVKHINITGINSSQDPNIETLVNLYLNKKLPWPQKNLLLLSKNGLKDYLLKNDPKILSLNSINKKFPNSLTVDASPRLDKFLLETTLGAYYSISNDGRTTAEVQPNASGTLPSGLVLIKLTGNQDVVLGGTILSGDKINFIGQLMAGLPDILKIPIINFELSDFESPDLAAIAESGLKLQFDLTSDAKDTLNHLSSLISQSSVGINNLEYIDMRFKDRGYVCAKGKPCASPTVLPKATTTSSTS